MAVTLVGAAQAGTNGTSITLTWPAVAAGDYAIVIWSSANSVTVTVDPTSQGFTQEDIQIGGTGQHRVAFYDKICTGSESGSVTLTNGALNRLSAVMLVLRGAHGVSPLDTFAFFQQTVAGTNHVCPAVTTGFADCVVVTAYSERFGTTTTNVAPPGTYTERAESGAAAAGSGGTDTEIADDGYAVSRAAGSVVNPGTYVGTGSTANIKLYTISVRPAVTAVNASAEASQLAVTAGDVSVQAATSAGNAAVALDGQNAQISLRPSPTEAAFGVAAGDAGVQGASGIEPALLGIAGLDATVSVSGNTTASAEAATIGFAGQDLTAAVSPSSEAAAVSYAAGDATASTGTVVAAQAAAIGYVAGDLGVQIAPHADVATITHAAADPSAAVAFTASPATLGFAADNPLPSIGVLPPGALLSLLAGDLSAQLAFTAEAAAWAVNALTPGVDAGHVVEFAVVEGDTRASGAREAVTVATIVDGHTRARIVE